MPLMPETKTRAPLLDSKFNPATSAAAIITRDRLQLPKMFIDGTARVAAISAPAGYGKSTALAGWRRSLEATGVKIAWLNLDESDNEPARFMRYLCSALERGGILSPTDNQAHLEGSEPALPTLEYLAVELASFDKRACLFLDDVHLIESEAVRHSIQWLCHYAPANFQLVLTGRNLTNLTLSRLRIRRSLVELDTEALKFTADEARIFFSSRGISDLSSSELNLLLQRTEGWPAGMELAAIMLENNGERGRLIEAFAGDQDNLMEYLGEVFLDTLDPQVRSFIYAIAQFKRISAPLAEAASGLKNCQQRLDTLYRGNFFLSRLDSQGEWFRFHQLIRDFLCRHGQRDEPERCRSALLRGARYYADQGLTYEAVQCAMRAEAWDTASRLLADHAEDLVVGQGYLQSLMGWIEQLPSEWLDRYPSIRVNHAFAQTFFGRHSEADQQIRILEDLHQQLQQARHPDLEQVRELECAIGALRSYLYALTDQREEALRESRQWLERWPDAEPGQLRGVSNVLTFAYKSCGQLDKALELSDRMQKWALEDSAGHYPYSWFFVLRCYLLLKRGNYSAAKSTAETGLHTIRELTGRGSWLNNGILHAILAMVHYERNEIAQANEELEQGLNEGDEYCQADHLIIRYLTQARLLRQRGDINQGLEVLQQGRALSERVGLERPALALAAEEITWLARDARLEEARELAAAMELDQLPAPGQHDLRTEKCLHTASRCHMASQPQRVAECLSDGISHCREAGLHHRLAEFLVLQAMAWDQAGCAEEAVSAMTEAVLLCAEHGYERVIRDEGAVLQKLLARIRLQDASQSAEKLLQRLQAKPPATAGDIAASNSELVEPLTKRELQILRRLQSDLSNREIAEAIFVSEGTLKWHLHNIYGKLCVRTRTGALSRAAELELI